MNTSLPCQIFSGNLVQLVVCLLAMFVIVADTGAGTTDAELEALEQQIEQQEKEQAETKQRLELEAKRKAEEEAKRQIELEKQRAAEDESRKMADEAERQQLADESKKRNYNELMASGQKALDNKDRNVAIEKYQEALTLIPDDTAAQSGIRNAEALMDKICYAFVGTWELEEFIGGLTIRVMEDGTFFHGINNDTTTTWDCLPEKRQITEKKFGWKYTLSDDGTCLQFEHRDNCFRR